MFNEEEIFGKQIELAESIFESTVTNIENMDSISFMESVMDEDIYMESKKTEKIKENLKKFFESIKNAIKDFFEKISTMIKGKIEDAKLKKAINDIKKSGIKNLNKIKVKGVNEDSFLKFTKEVVEEASKYSKKIINAKTRDEIEKYEKELQDKMETMTNGFEVRALNGEFEVDAFGNVIQSNTVFAIKTLGVQTCEKLNDMVIKKEEEVVKEEFDNAIKERKDAVRSALKSVTSAFSRTIKKIGSMMTTTQGKIISGILAAAAVAAGTRKVVKNNKNKNVNESVDDIFDSLLEDIGV